MPWIYPERSPGSVLVGPLPLRSCLRDDSSNSSIPLTSRLESVLDGISKRVCEINNSFLRYCVNQFKRVSFSLSLSFYISLYLSLYIHSTYIRILYRFVGENEIYVQFSLYYSIHESADTRAADKRFHRDFLNGITSIAPYDRFPRWWIKPFLSTYSFTRTWIYNRGGAYTPS